MKKNGFGIVAMFALIVVFALCLCISAFFYQKFNHEEKTIIEDIPLKKDNNSLGTITSMYDYSILEQSIKNAAKNYLNDNKLNESLSLIISSKDLIEKNYLSNFYDLADEKNLCNGYVVYKSNKYTPYIWCKGSYATEGYDVNLE